VLEFLAEGDKTMGEIRKHTRGKQQNYFLLHARRMGLVNRYYNKKNRKYYFKLLDNKYKGLFDKEEGRIQLRIVSFLLKLMGLLFYLDSTYPSTGGDRLCLKSLQKVHLAQKVTILPKKSYYLCTLWAKPVTAR
jgi:hypothetical protein